MTPKFSHYVTELAAQAIEQGEPIGETPIAHYTTTLPDGTVLFVMGFESEVWRWLLWYLEQSPDDKPRLLREFIAQAMQQYPDLP